MFRKKTAPLSKVALFSKTAPQRSCFQKKFGNSSFSSKEALFWLLWGTILAPSWHCFQPFFLNGSSLSKVALFRLLSGTTLWSGTKIAPQEELSYGQAYSSPRGAILAPLFFSLYLRGPTTSAIYEWWEHDLAKFELSCNSVKTNQT